MQNRSVDEAEQREARRNARRGEGMSARRGWTERGAREVYHSHAGDCRESPVSLVRELRAADMDFAMAIPPLTIQTAERKRRGGQNRSFTVEHSRRPNLPFSPRPVSRDFAHGFYRVSSLVPFPSQFPFFSPADPRGLSSRRTATPMCTRCSRIEYTAECRLSLLFSSL